MKKFFMIITLVILFCLWNCPHLFALEEKTHEKINQFIAESNLNGFELDRYLKEQLGFSKGVETQMRAEDDKFKPSKGYQIWRWIGAGGKWEDNPPPFFKWPFARSLNHFHDPISNGGYTNYWLLIPPLPILYNPWPDSALEWFHEPLESQNTGGYYSWSDVRAYFHEALISDDQTAGEDAFAHTFRGLGQLMHLVEDMSVPLHTRDDGHATGYEGWVKSHLLRHGVPASCKPSEPYHFLSTETSVIRNTADLFDMDKYDGTNPQVIAPGNEIGLSEYSNANFFSYDTIGPGSGFPYPLCTDNIEPTSIADVRDPDREVLREYHLWNDGYEAEDYRLTTTSFVTEYWTKAGSEVHELEVPAILDGNVYADYAERLIPRAIGYGSEVLKYFFRGRMELTRLSPDISDTGTEGFDRFVLFARNVSPEGEDMTGGTLTLVIRYRFDENDEFQYIVSRQGAESVTVPRDTAARFEFDISGGDRFPWDAETYAYLVYRGRLGSENDAVAVGFGEYAGTMGISLPDTGIYAFSDIKPDTFIFIA